MIDGRLKGTKCAGCMDGRYLILSEIRYTNCADCKDRPNRDKDKSRFKPDIESEWLKELMDKDAQKGTAAEY